MSFSKRGRWLASGQAAPARDRVHRGLPAALKLWYMRPNALDVAGRETVMRFDLLAPEVGELVRGWPREELLERPEVVLAPQESSREDHRRYLHLRQYEGACTVDLGLN